MNENYIFNKEAANRKKDRPATCDYCHESYKNDDDWWDDWNDHNDLYCNSCFLAGKQILNILRP